MMSNHSELYSNLMALADREGGAFFFRDQGDYRVFNYRLASYTDFCLPDALEARGIMFYMGGKEPYLVCRPFKKFFNLDETPFTMGLDLSKIEIAAVKEDGSLITSFIDIPTGELRLKSKQALASEQALMAMHYLNHNTCSDLRSEVTEVTELGYTVMFELVSPANRIVLEYSNTELRVIGIRAIEDGRVLLKSEFEEEYPEISNAWVESYSPSEGQVDESFVRSIPGLVGIEGFVLTMDDGLMVKVKTDWYKNLHHLKDSVNSIKQMFEAVIEERADDVKAMFPTDEITLSRISEMEKKVIPIYNGFVSKVENFYTDNKTLERREYAIKGQLELGLYFGLGMALYVGREPDFKGHAKKYREEIFGLSEEVEELVISEN